MRLMDGLKKIVDRDYGWIEWKEYEGLKHNFKVATNLVMEEL